jgi:hypothetical protein
MKTLLGRELRARGSLYFVALGGAAVALWGFMIIGMADPYLPFLGNFFSAFSPQGEYTLLTRLFLNGIFIGSLGYAFLLGILQVAIESKQGVEPFLLHQPVPRGRIMVAKFLAGLILYFGALLPIFAGRVLWAATPWGHFGPFRWEMAYPGLIQILAALIVYPATLWAAAGQKRERWIGVIAVGVALVVAVTLSNVCEPPYVELGAIGSILILLWGAARAYEEREP